MPLASTCQDGLVKLQSLSGNKLNKENLKLILDQVKTIAIVGASSNPDRDSYKVMKFLIDYEYQIFPVNPNESNILGRKCYPTLKSIEEKIDMVDVFRAKEFVFDITTEAIEIDAKILWTQEHIIDENAASLGRSSGLKVIMNECPKKILQA